MESNGQALLSSCFLWSSCFHTVLSLTSHSPIAYTEFSLFSSALGISGLCMGYPVCPEPTSWTLVNSYSSFNRLTPFYPHAPRVLSAHLDYKTDMTLFLFIFSLDQELPGKSDHVFSCVELLSLIFMMCRINGGLNEQIVKNLSIHLKLS